MEAPRPLAAPSTSAAPPVVVEVAPGSLELPAGGGLAESEAVAWMAAAAAEAARDGGGADAGAEAEAGPARTGGADEDAAEADEPPAEADEPPLAGPAAPHWPPTPPESKAPAHKWRARGATQTGPTEILQLAEYEEALANATTTLTEVKAGIKEMKTQERISSERLKRETEERLVAEHNVKVRELRVELDERAKQIAAANRSKLLGMEAVIERRLRDASAEERKHLIEEAHDARKSLERALAMTRQQLASAQHAKERVEEEVDRLRSTNSALHELVDGEVWKERADAATAKLAERDAQLAEAEEQRDSLRTTLDHERERTAAAERALEAMHAELAKMRSDAEEKAREHEEALHAERERATMLQMQMDQQRHVADERIRGAQGDLAREADLNNRRRDKHLKVIEMLTAKVQNLTAMNERLHTQVDRYKNIIVEESRALAEAEESQEATVSVTLERARMMPDDDIVPTAVKLGVPSPLHIRQCVEGMRSAMQTMDSAQRRATNVAYHAALERPLKKVPTLPFLTRVKMHHSAKQQQTARGFLSDRPSSERRALDTMEVQWRREGA